MTGEIIKIRRLRLTPVTSQIGVTDSIGDKQNDVRPYSSGRSRSCDCREQQVTGAQGWLQDSHQGVEKTFTIFSPH
jgi:hypothetical protein